MPIVPSSLSRKALLSGRETLILIPYTNIFALCKLVYVQDSFGLPDHSDSMDTGRSAMDLALKSQVARDVEKRLSWYRCKLYESGDYTDLTVIYAGKRFDVHKAIVCSRTPFTKEACDAEKWVVYIPRRTSSHGQDGAITWRPTQDAVNPESDGMQGLICDDTEAVKHMFDFMYLHTYGGPPSCSNDSIPADAMNLRHYASVYTLGEKYGIAGLKEASFQRCEHSVEASWKTDTFCEATKIVLSLNWREMVADSHMEIVDANEQCLSICLHPHMPCRSSKEYQKRFRRWLFLGWDCDQEQFCENYRDSDKIRKQDLWS